MEFRLNLISKHFPNNSNLAKIFNKIAQATFPKY